MDNLLKNQAEEQLIDGVKLKTKITKGIYTFFIEEVETKRKRKVYQIRKFDNNAIMKTDATIFNPVMLFENIGCFATKFDALYFMNQNENILM